MEAIKARDEDNNSKANDGVSIRKKNTNYKEKENANSQSWGSNSHPFCWRTNVLNSTPPESMVVVLTGEFTKDTLEIPESTQKPPFQNS